MGLPAMVLRPVVSSYRRYAVVAPPLSKGSRVHALVVGASHRYRGLACLCLFMGERSGCFQSLWPTADRRHHYSACAPCRFAGKHGTGCCHTGSLGYVVAL